ncbi:hypothetical protein CDAR_301841 [Caerostris darwini]|uniref:Uncharacterized protein n=1 Tax=Caerostris darwini TaxID=1538125 RepID=A0AAV4VD48_9ARAC|nr:hypothetical protein CDAR_301841 [Caerostris darwini]
MMNYVIDCLFTHAILQRSGKFTPGEFDWKTREPSAWTSFSPKQHHRPKSGQFFIGSRDQVRTGKSPDLEREGLQKAPSVGSANLVHLNKKGHLITDEIRRKNPRGSSPRVYLDKRRAKRHPHPIVPPSASHFVIGQTEISHFSIAHSRRESVPLKEGPRDVGGIRGRGLSNAVIVFLFGHPLLAPPSEMFCGGT